LARPLEKEIVPPIVASVWRELVPNYTVRDVFSAKREEVRQKAAGMITQKLAADGIVGRGGVQTEQGERSCHGRSGL
jgi:regulator of protease activity HflC (stomatin/prohibitin superfamily)